MKNKNINFVDAHRKSLKKDRESSRLFFIWLILPIIAAAALGYDYSRQYLKLKEYHQIAEWKSQSAHPAGATCSRETIINSMKEEVAITDAQPRLTEEHFSAIFEMAGTEMEIIIDHNRSIEYKNQLLSFTAATVDYHNIADYISRLEQFPVFRKVNYNGFEQVGDQYYFQVSCELGD